MSNENVEIIRRAYEAFNRGDREAAFADMDPAVEWIPSGALPDSAPVYRGLEAYKDFIRWLWDQFDDTHAELHELRGAGDRVVASLTLRGRGKQSGAETSWRLWHVWTVRGGKVVHGRAVTDEAEALEAAGLSG